MSCDRTQRQAATAAAPAGISRAGSKGAGLAGQTGETGSVARKRKKRQPRRVRPAVKGYQKLSLKKKEQLWTMLAEATMRDNETQRRQRLKKAVLQFGAGLVAAAVAEASERARQEQDDWALKRYGQVVEMLAGVKMKAKAKAKAEERPQVGFFEDESDRDSDADVPSSGQVDLTAVFSRQDLEQMQTRTLLGGAATARQLKLLSSGATRGIEFGDPRVKDWLAQDQQTFRFLSRQLARHTGALDTTALSEAELVDLWEFSRFEADRALRNIDHLTSGWSHLKDETADYMTGNYTLEARFYTYLADQLAPRITTEMRDKYSVLEI